MNINDRNKIINIIFNEAKELFVNICPKGIKTDQYFKKEKSFKNKSDILYTFLMCFQEEYTSNKITDIDKQEINKIFKKSLYDYDCEMILEQYNESQLFNTLHLEFSNSENKSITIDWQLYAKFILTAAKFLHDFKNATAFDDFVKEYDQKKMELLYYLQSNIFGINFSLACYILQELGYEEYVKPNIHIKDLLITFDLCKDSDFSIYHTIMEMSNIVQQSTYYISQLFYLVCSGNFYYNNVTIGRNKEKLIYNILNVFNQTDDLEINIILQNSLENQIFLNGNIKILQTTVIRKYINNHKYTYGRITLDNHTTSKFLGSIETCKIIVKYNEEKDCLIIEKLENN